DDCDGLIDEGFPPKNTTISGAMCNTILPAIDSQLYADNVPGAQGYRWRVTTMTGISAGQVQLLDTPLRVMKLTQLANYAFKTQYKIELAVYYAGYLQPFQSSNCTVTTPDTTTKLTVCGQTLTAMTNSIYANIVPYGTGYRFRVTDPANPANTQTMDRTTRDFRMNLITAFTVQYGKVYNVEVAVKNTDGTYLSFGQTCQVTTPVFPTTSLDDATCDDYQVADSNTQIYAYSVPGAAAYVFKLSGPGLPGGSAEVTKLLRAFRLSDFTGLIPSATYNVQVRVVFNFSDAPGPYGKTCTVIAPGLSRPSTPVAVGFKAVAYPNPFADNFSLNVTTASDDNISVKVYDMTGRLLETRIVNADEIKSLELGDSYPAGVYNVIVGQSTEVKTLRVIKR
ncbi:MAG: T9SS type A sorting domain-containing protein, partial [Sphingobacteriales bacterium]